MRKYLLTLLFANIIYHLSFTQITDMRVLHYKMDSLKKVLQEYRYTFSFDDKTIYDNTRHEIDSLKKILPTLKGNDKVDCMNTLAYKYFRLPIHWILETDSAYPYAIQAYNEAIRIGYTKGLGYSYLRLGTIASLRVGVGLQTFNLLDNVLLDSAEYFIKQAISTGQKLNNNDILGGAYWVYGWIEEGRGNTSKYIDYLKKAILYYEKSPNQSRQGVYRDLNEIDCKSCVGNEIAMGSLLMEISRFYWSNQEFDKLIEYARKALIIYEKIGNKGDIAYAHRIIGNGYAGKNDFDSAINNLERAIQFSSDAGGKKDDIAIYYANILRIYISTGDFENGLETGKKYVQLAETIPKDENGHNAHVGNSLFIVSILYNSAGDYETASDLLRKAFQYYPPQDSQGLDFGYAVLGNVYRLKGNKDSALYYLKPLTTRNTWGTVIGLVYLGNLYVDLKEYDKALPVIESYRRIGKKVNDIGSDGIALTLKAGVYLGKKDYMAALNFALEGLQILKRTKRKMVIIENYELLSNIYHSMGRSDSAYFYLKQYMQLRDSLLNRQFYFRLNNYKKQAEEDRKASQINLLNKENQLKEQKLKQEATIRNSLIAGLALLFLLGIFVFRNLLLKRRNEKLRMQKDFEVQKLESEKKQAELEMQALRAQMNPHFIFNCLSSINRFILKNESKIASNYLTRFSRLMRMVLNNSQRSLISLDDELEMLEIYLEMERLRFKNSFDYGITFLNTVDSDNIFIPPLLLQPFCENAIWHGLMNKEGQGKLDVELSMENNILICVISDNGAGREKAEELKSKTVEKDKSMGLKITTERLALLNREKGLHTTYELIDLKDDSGHPTGTRVVLKISFKSSIEEPA